MNLANLLGCLIVHCASAQNYGAALGKSILFYEAQRSGKLPSGHRVGWRGDSQLGDGSDVGLDLSGGWYDAGDHVKFGFPMAWSVTTLAWGLIEFKDAYSSTGNLQHMYNSLRVPLEYFIKCHVSDNVFYGQVGNGYADHSVWNRPESINMNRPSYKIDTRKPGSDLAAETSAAMAAGSMAFRNKDLAFSNTLLDHAKKLFTFAEKFKGKYSDFIPANDFYRSSGYNDELCWAATWLYRATGQNRYLNYAKQYYSTGVPWAFSWDSKEAGAQLNMYIITKETKYKTHVQSFLNSWRPGGGITYTPGGLAWRDQWGPLRYAGNTAAISVIASKYGIDEWATKIWAKDQINYMLKDNPKGISYMIQEKSLRWSPRKPHHRSSSCNPDHSVPCSWADYHTVDDNDSLLIGALVGGPNDRDQYTDRRDDYISNEVACDYNAGFQTALAGLVYLG